MLFFSFLKCFWQTHTHVLIRGPCDQCFEFLATSLLYFKAKVNSALCAFAKVDLIYIPWDPPLLLHLPSFWQNASSFPTCISKGRNWFRIEWAITHTEDESANVVFLALGLKMCFLIGWLNLGLYFYGNAVGLSLKIMWACMPRYRSPLQCFKHALVTYLPLLLITYLCFCKFNSIWIY